MACTCSSEPFKVGLGAYGDLGLPELGEENPASPNQSPKHEPEAIHGWLSKLGSLFGSL